jgi:hypothetical protein
MSILLAYSIEGVPVTISNMDVAIKSGLSPFVVSEEEKEGYIDISSIQNWYSYMDYLDVDYKFSRDEIKKLFYKSTHAWEDLTIEEKTILAKLMLVSKMHRDEVMSQLEQDKEACKHISKITVVRKERYEKLLSYIYTRLTRTDRKELYTILDKYRVPYVTYGEESIDSDMRYGILDFIKSISGIIPAEGTLEDFIKGCRGKIVSGS